ncbi:MAG TPA: creatininase family protein [Firmicutes bacterium]|nr:creatininase family protein [Bacillota bacterium]
MKDIVYAVRGSKTMYEMTWAEVEELRQKTKTVIVSVGSFEQHGTHLPMAADTLQALEIAKDAADILAEQGMVVAVGPAIPFGVNPGAMPFPGSVSLRPDTLKTLIVEVGLSLKAHGFSNVVLLMGHDENIPAMMVAAQELVHEHGMRVMCLNWLPYLKLHEKKVLDLKGADGHGGAGETARMLARFPELVSLDVARAYTPPPAPPRPELPYAGPPLLGGGVYDPAKDLPGFAPPAHPGIVGDPRLANAEAGEKAYRVTAEWVAEVIKREFF